MKFPKIIYPLISITFYFCIMCVYAREVSARGMDLISEAEDIVELENGYLPLDEEIESDPGELLQDTIQDITQVDDDNSENFTEDSTYSEDNIENSESDLSMAEIMNEDQYRIMVIFCFGLLAGVVVGHFLTGFIK